MFQYEPFKDSTEHLNDGETLRARLAEDGYLFLRGLLPRKAILDVRVRLLNKATEGGWLAPASPVAVANSAAACKDPEPRYMSVFRGLWSDETLHRLRIDPRVIALFRRIFGERALAHPMLFNATFFLSQMVSTSPPAFIRIASTSAARPATRCGCLWGTAHARWVL
jgi:hypothetical protein